MVGTEIAERLRAAVIEGATPGLQDLLHPRAEFMALGKTLAGAPAVLAELAAESTRATWRTLRWRPAEAVGSAVRLIGERAPGSDDRGLVLTLTVEGGCVTRIQQQRTPPPPPPASAIVLPQALREAIDRALVERHPMLMAHVGADGQPVLSYRGSTQVHSDDQLAMWVRNADGAFIHAIRAHPPVALMYRNEDSRATYQFQGRARVSDATADRQRVFERSAEAERAHDFAMLGVAVLIDLDRVEGYAGVGPQGQIGRVHMVRDGAPDSLKASS